MSLTFAQAKVNFYSADDNADDNAWSRIGVDSVSGIDVLRLHLCGR